MSSMAFHLSNAYGGLAVGIAFLSTIGPRGQGEADRLGGKVCMQRGLILYAAAGLICLLASLAPVARGSRLCRADRRTAPARPGRKPGHGGHDQLGHRHFMGQARSGKVMSLVGMGMYGAFAAGGPLGLALLDHIGFAGLMGVCTVVPLLGLIAIHRLPAVAPHAGQAQKSSGGSSAGSGGRVPRSGCRAWASLRWALSFPSIS